MRLFRIVVTGANVFASRLGLALAILLFPAGLRAWTVEIHGGLNDDSISGIAVGATDEVYAAGSILTPDGGKGLIKLAQSNGAEFWRGAGSNGPVLVAPDGDLVAAGGQLAKYSAITGARLWSHGTGGIGPHSLALDPAGYVAYAGRGGGGSGSPDMLVSLHSLADGSPVWAKAIDGSAGHYDSANAVSVDADGDVIVGGYLTNLGSDRDFTVMKLSGLDGSEIWRRELDGLLNSYDSVLDIALDASGDVLAVGYLQEIAWTDFAVIKLSAEDGAEIWRYVISGTGANSNETAVAVAVNALSDVFVTGTIKNPITANDILVVKLNGSTGEEIWQTQLDGTEASEPGDSDIGRAIDLDSLGNVFVGGDTRNTGTGLDFTVAKLAAADGGERWRFIANGSSNGSDAVEALAIDNEDNVIAGGVVDNWATGTRVDALVVKLANVSGSADVCADEIDNDHDGYTDLGFDLGCGGPLDPTEEFDCEDLFDNDSDGFIDFPDDPGCRSAVTDFEDAACQDGDDNDDDGLIDFDGGQSIWGACTGEPDGCPRNVSDPDNNGVADPDPNCLNSYRNNEAPYQPPCGLSAELALLLPPLMWIWRQRRAWKCRPQVT